MSQSRKITVKQFCSLLLEDQTVAVIEEHSGWYSTNARYLTNTAAVKNRHVDHAYARGNTIYLIIESEQ